MINVNGLERAYDGVFFSGEYGYWASFDDAAKDQLIEHMRNVHGVKQQYINGWDSQMRDFTAKNHAGIKTAKQFTWKNSAQELLNGLSL